MLLWHISAATYRCIATFQIALFEPLLCQHTSSGLWMMHKTNSFIAVSLANYLSEPKLSCKKSKWRTITRSLRLNWSNLGDKRGSLAQNQLNLLSDFKFVSSLYSWSLKYLRFQKKGKWYCCCINFGYRLVHVEIISISLNIARIVMGMRMKGTWRLEECSVWLWYWWQSWWAWWEW